jgi:mRNA interferase RelE/StbE
MRVVFDKSFIKSIRKIKDPAIKKKLEEVLTNVELAETIRQIPNLKKMQGFDNYYRIRLGDYRIGFEIEAKDIVRFIIIAHRQHIYNDFP